MVTIDWRIVWEVINFLFLLWLLKKYLYSPITEMLDKRAEKIEDDLRQAEESKKEAEDLKQKYEAELQAAREKAQEIIEDAEKRGKEKAEEIVQEAREEATRLRERNQEEIARAKEEALSELRQEITGISLMVAGKFMQDKLAEEDHKELIQQYINNLDDKKLGEVQ